MSQAKLTYANYIMLAVDSIRTRCKKLTTTYRSIADRAGVSPRILSNWKKQGVHRPRGNRGRAVLKAAFSLVGIEVTDSQFETLIAGLLYVSQQSAEYQAAFNVQDFISDVLSATEKDALAALNKASPSTQDVLPENPPTKGQSIRRRIFIALRRVLSFLFKNLLIGLGGALDVQKFIFYVLLVTWQAALNIAAPSTQDVLPENPPTKGQSNRRSIFIGLGGALFFLTAIALTLINPADLFFGNKDEISNLREPEVSEPEVSEPEVSEPEVSEPEVSEPEVSEPEVSKQIEQLWQDGHADRLSGNNILYHAAMNKALQLATDYFGNNSEYYARSQNHMIGAFGALGQYTDAVDAAEEAIRVYSQLQGNNSLVVAQNKVNLAAKLWTIGHAERVENTLTEALEIYASLPPTVENTIGLAGWHEAVSQILIDQDNLESASEHAHKAVLLIEGTGETRTITFGSALMNAAWVERDAGNCGPSRALFSRAAEVFNLAGANKDFPDRARAEREARVSC